MVKLKKIYNIATEASLAEKVEEIHNTTGKTYTEIFLEAFKEKYGVE